MKAFGFLSFGHHALGNRPGPTAAAVLQDSLTLAQEADKIGVNGAYFRVHHFAPQGASPMPLLGAIAGSTKHIEVGTGVIDMRYENPLHFAEETAALDLLSNHRIALGVSRGSPEPADKGWECFGYHGDTENGADLARAHFEKYMSALRGEAVATAAGLDKQYPRMYKPSIGLPTFPQSDGVTRRIWWGAGSHSSAEQAARDGVNLMSSTLVSEADGSSLGDIQALQIEKYRDAWREAGHDWAPRVSVSRTVFPIVDDRTRQMFGIHEQSKDQIGDLGEGSPVTFGRTYAAEPGKLIEQLRADAAVMSADTLMLTIPNQIGVPDNLAILRNFAEHVAPELGWISAKEGPVTGYEVE